MSKKAKEAALKAYPEKLEWDYRDMDYDPNMESRIAYQQGYEQAEGDTIERACQLLYDYNSQMVKIFGPKAFLSCNQFTIDVDRFRKTLIMEEEK